MALVRAVALLLVALVPCLAISRPDVLSDGTTGGAGLISAGDNSDRFLSEFMSFKQMSVFLDLLLFRRPWGVNPQLA